MHTDKEIAKNVKQSDDRITVSIARTTEMPYLRTVVKMRQNEGFVKL